MVLWGKHVHPSVGAARPATCRMAQALNSKVFGLSRCSLFRGIRVSGFQSARVPDGTSCKDSTRPASVLQAWASERARFLQQQPGLSSIRFALFMDRLTPQLKFNTGIPNRPEP